VSPQNTIKPNSRLHFRLLKIRVIPCNPELELIYLMGMFMKLFSGATRKIFAAIV
jgi:hypothetical protein